MIRAAPSPCRPSRSPSSQYSPQPGYRTPGQKPTRASHRSFRDLVQRGRAAALRPRHALPALVLVPRREGDLRGGAQGRSRLRHRLLGHRAQPARQSAQRPAGPTSRPGSPPSRRPRRSAPRPSASATTSTRWSRCIPITTSSHPAHPRAIRRRWKRWRSAYPDDDEAQIAYAITLNTSADLNDKTYAQQIKGAAILEPIFQAPAAASGRRPLPDPPLRLSGDRRRRASTPPTAMPRSRRPRRTPSTCRRTSTPASATGRSRSAPTSPRCEPRRPRKESARPAARHGLHGLCPPPARPGQAGARRHRRDDAGSPASTRPFLPRRLCAGGLSPARYAVERGDWNGAAQLRSGRAPSPTSMRSRISPARSARRAPASRTPPRPTSPSSPSCATSCARPRTPIGPEQVDIQRQVATAWVLYAEGKHDDALKAMSAAADAEDKTEKHPVTPGPADAGARALRRHAARARHGQGGARRLRGDQGQGAEPLGAELGAAQAAEKAGDKAKARENYQKLIALTAERRSEPAGGRRARSSWRATSARFEAPRGR